MYGETSPTRRALLSAATSPQAGEVREHSILQIFARPVEPAKRKSGLGKSFAGALFAVDHGEYKRDLSPGIARRFHRFQRRLAGRGDILDNHYALALQALALRQALDRKPGAVLLRLLAHEKRRDRMALDPGELRDCAGKRHRAHLEPADVIEAVV